MPTGEAKTVSMSKTISNAITKIADLCESKGVMLVLVNPPQLVEEVFERPSCTREFIWIDGNLWPGAKTPSNYYDDHHLVGEGAKRYSKWLSNQVERSLNAKKWRRCGQLDATMPELAGVICPKTAPSIVAVLLCFHSPDGARSNSRDSFSWTKSRATRKSQRRSDSIGNVKLGHQDAVLSCDSAWRFEGGRVEIFGEVRMNQLPSTTMQSQHLVIQPGEDWVAASGNVVFNHESSRLEAPSISYSIPNRQAKYVNGASIYEEDWNIISQSGTYWATDELLHLGENIMAIQETDTLWSDSHWNRLDDRYSFLRHSLWKGAEMSRVPSRRHPLSRKSSRRLAVRWSMGFRFEGRGRWGQFDMATSVERSLGKRSIDWGRRRCHGHWRICSTK